MTQTEHDFEQPSAKMKRLEKEVERLSILVSRCNCLTMQEYEATLDELKKESENE